MFGSKIYLLNFGSSFTTKHKFMKLSKTMKIEIHRILEDVNCVTNAFTGEDSKVLRDAFERRLIDLVTLAKMETATEIINFASKSTQS